MGRPPSHRLRGTTAEQLVNVDSLLIWLSNVVQFVKLMDGSPSAALVNYTRTPEIAERHPLILDGFFLRLRSLRSSGERNCACTFYLVFKEPALLAVHHPASISPCGEPYENNETSQPCQAFLIALTFFWLPIPGWASNASDPRSAHSWGKNTGKGTAC